MARTQINMLIGGESEIMLDCPMCDFYEIVNYATRPPIYCSDRCKQMAYRKRKKAEDAKIRHPHTAEKLNLSRLTAKALEQFSRDYSPAATRDLITILELAKKDNDKMWKEDIAEYYKRIK